MGNALVKLNAGTVQIRGETIDLGSTEARQLIVALAQEAEEILSVDHIKRYFDFTDTDIAELSQNVDLERAVLLEKQKRLLDGSATRDKAAVYHAEAPDVLRGIMTDRMERAAARVQAEERLAKLSVGGPDGHQGYQGPRFPIFIITSSSPEGRRVIDVGPSKEPVAPEEQSLQPITVISRDHPDDAGSQFALSQNGEVDS